MKSDFFKTDTAEKYYILGLLYSDGYLCENSSSHKEYVGLKLIDKQILDDISKVTGCKEPFKAGITSAGNQLYKIEFRDSEVISDLKSIGLHRRKTFTITYPDIPEEYHRDFIRGVFDGDGCIHFALKRGRCNSYVTNFQIIGTFNLLEGISEHIGVSVRIVPYRKVAKLLVDKKSDVISIYNYLYHDEDCLCLQRKHQHFNECVSTIYDSQERQKTYIKKKQEPRMTKEEFVMRANDAEQPHFAGLVPEDDWAVQVQPAHAEGHGQTARRAAVPETRRVHLRKRLCLRGQPHWGDYQ